MELMYTSTRNANEKVTASQAILKGLAEDGGLFVPEQLPTLDKTVDELAGMTYQETAYEVMKLFLSDFTEEELKHCINGAYDDKFDTKEIAPLVKKDGAYYLELFHGATIAFKDMALSILPHLLTTSAKKNDVKNEIVILKNDIEKTIKNKVKSILERHTYQNNKELQGLTQAADEIITNILDEKEVIEKVFDIRERSADIYEHSIIGQLKFHGNSDSASAEAR